MQQKRLALALTVGFLAVMPLCADSVAKDSETKKEVMESVFGLNSDGAEKDSDKNTKERKINTKPTISKQKKSTSSISFPQYDGVLKKDKERKNISKRNSKSNECADPSKLSRELLKDMGKGVKLNEREVDLALLTFAKEKERDIKRRKLREKMAEMKKKYTPKSSSKMREARASRTPPPKRNKPLSLDEQKARLDKGMTQFPKENKNKNSDNSNSVGTVANTISSVLESVSFYGTSCVGKHCTAIGKNNKNYSIGQIINGDEKIVYIGRSKIKTNKRIFDLAEGIETPITKKTTSSNVANVSTEKHLPSVVNDIKEIDSVPVKKTPSVETNEQKKAKMNG